MSVDKKIEMLLEKEMIRDPEDPSTFASPEERARIAAAAAKAKAEEMKVPEGLDMTGDPSDPGDPSGFTEPSDHNSIVGMLKAAQEHFTENTTVRLINGKIVKTVDGKEVSASQPAHSGISSNSASEHTTHSFTPANPANYGAANHDELMNKVVNHVNSSAHLDDNMLGQLLGY
jgi:hypothetical protein